MIDRKDITGLVLAGGRASRMGGVDKGLQPHLGSPLALHALQRLVPQVGRVALSANRNLPLYQRMGVPVWPDDLPGYPGPLAGVLAGLARCDSPWLATVPCDSPLFPADLVARLAAAADAAGAELAVASSLEAGRRRLQPVFCLLSVPLRESLERYIRSGQSKVESWLAQHRAAEVVFDDAHAFSNANTREELRALQA